MTSTFGCGPPTGVRKAFGEVGRRGVAHLLERGIEAELEEVAPATSTCGLQSGKVQESGHSGFAGQLPGAHGETPVFAS